MATEPDSTSLAGAPTRARRPGGRADWRPMESRRPPGAHHAVAAVALGLGLLALTSTLRTVDFGNPVGGGDLQYYEKRANQIRANEIPYHDFYYEYPPASIPVIVLPLSAPGSYVQAFRIEQWLLAATALVLAVGVTLRSTASVIRLYATAAFIGVSPLLLGSVLFNRFDLWPAALVAGGLVAVLFGRERLGFGILAVATAAKIYPVVVTAVALLWLFRERGLRRARDALLVWALVGLVITLPFAIIAFGGLGYSFYTQFTRGLQVESLAASTLLAAHQLGVYDPTIIYALSNDIGGTAASVLAAFQSVVQVGAVALVLLLLWQVPKPVAPELLLTASAAAVTAFVTFGKVLSPQYVIWLIPLVPVVARSIWIPATALLGLALVLTNLWFPEHYGDVIHLTGWGWLVLVRNLVLVALFGVLVSPLALARRRASRPLEAAGSRPAPATGG